MGHSSVKDTCQRIQGHGAANCNIRSKDCELIPSGKSQNSGGGQIQFVFIKTITLIMYPSMNITLKRCLSHLVLFSLHLRPGPTKR